MASSLTKMRMLAVTTSFTTTTTTSPRFRFPSRRQFSCFGEEFHNIMNIGHHSVVKLESSFGNSSSRVGNGVFVRPWVIVTSAHVVGRVTGSDCEVGRTAATTVDGKVLRTQPLAVNFGGDVAVLHAVGDADSVPPPAPLAYEVGCKESPLMVTTRHESCKGRAIFEFKVRAADDTSPRTEWVHPVGDDFGWARYGGTPEGKFPIYPGSPWINHLYEVVGIASWAVGKEPHASGFVVPPPRIRAALDYGAKNGDQDRIVMDHWIEKVTTAADGCDDHIFAKECGSIVPSDCIVSAYLPAGKSESEC